MKYNIRIVDKERGTSRLESVTGYEVKNDIMRAFIHRSVWSNKWWSISEYYSGTSARFFCDTTRKGVVKSFLDYARTRNKEDIDKIIDRVVAKHGYANGSEEERKNEADL
jgi:hypothetical protein